MSLARAKILGAKRTPPLIGPGFPYDITPKALPGAFRMGFNAGAIATTNYPDAAMMSYFASRGANFIRLNLNWTTLQPTLKSHDGVGALSQTAFTNVSKVLATAALFNMPVLIDANHSIADGAGRAEGAIGSSGVPVSDIVDYLQKISAACLADPNYALVHGYDTTNEWHLMPGDPTNVSTPTSRALIADAQQRIINAVRGNGDNAAIYIEGDHYSGAWDWVANNGAWFLALNDPTNNLVASIHFYLDRDSSGSADAHSDWVAETQAAGSAPPGLNTNLYIGPQRLSGPVAWAYQHGVKLHVGECGWNNTSDEWRQAGEATLAYVKACNVEITYWASGYDFGSSYAYGPEPLNASGTARDFSPLGVPRQQGKSIQKYAGPPAAFPLYLPYDGSNKSVNRGTSGVATGAFQFLFGGNVASPITVKPRARLVDGTDAGGTFNPSTITIAAGSYVDQAQQFAYTPASTDTFQIDLVDGVGNPLPAVYGLDENGKSVLSALGFATASDNFATAAVVPSNIFALRRLYAPYIGPAIKLKRASDGAQKNFYFNRRGDLPRQAIQDWASSRSIQIVTIYDQSPNGKHLTPAGTAPVLTLVNSQGYPEIAWASGCLMQFDTSAIQQGAMTVMARANPSANGTILSNDNFVDNIRLTTNSFFTAPNGSHSTVSIAGAATGSWEYLGGTWSNSYGTNNLKAYLNGGAAGQTNQATFTSPVGTYTVVGNNSFGGVPFAGALTEIIVSFEEYDSTRMSAFASSASTYYSTALPDSLSAAPPTIAGTAPTSVTQGSSDQPFTPATITDTNSGSPTDSVSIALSGGAGTLTGTGLSGTGPYTLAADTAANITTKLRALQWTPSGSAGASTTFTLTVTSSAGTSASDAQTVVTVQAYQAETPLAAPSGTWTPKAGAASYKGVNIGGAESGVGNAYPCQNAFNYAYPEADELDYFSSKGLGIIRMPISGPRLQPVAYGLADPIGRTDEVPNGYRFYNNHSVQTNIQSIRQVLDRAFTNGQRVIIDMHDYGNVWDSRVGGNVTLTSTSAYALFADQWSRLATIFKNYPNVVFGLMNEPHLCSAQQFHDAAVAALAAIRAAGANQLVLIAGGGNYDDAEQWAGTMGTIWDTFNQPGWAGTNGDPANNFAFEGHKYFDTSNNGNSSNYYNKTGAQFIGGMTTWCRQTNGGVARANPFKAFLGETGWVPDSSVTSRYGQAAVSGSVQPSIPSSSTFDFMSANSDVWLGWTFFLGGSRHFSSTYTWGHVVPGGASNSVGWTAATAGSFTDQPQMAQLLAHL